MEYRLRRAAIGTTFPVIDQSGEKRCGEPPGSGLDLSTSAHDPSDGLPTALRPRLPGYEHPDARTEAMNKRALSESNPCIKSVDPACADRPNVCPCR